jgi:hypothetical protein
MSTIIYVLLIVLILWLYACYVSKYVRRHDVVLNVISYKLDIFFSCLMTRHFDNPIGIPTYHEERLMQLMNKFKSYNLEELSIHPTGETAYTVNKNVVKICLENKVYPHRIYNINSIMFVLLHELTHIANDTWHHDVHFWKLFKYVLTEAVQCGVYKPIDYAVYPERYCNTTITYNPLYDSEL